jgi:Zn-dependent metalloprotease
MTNSHENPIEELGQEIEELSKDVQKKVKKEWRIFKRFSHKNEDKLMFAAFLVLVSAIFVVNTIYIANRLPQKQKVVYIGNTVVSPQTVVNSSQIARTDAFDVSIKNVAEKDQKDPAFTFADNETLLYLTIKIKNNTSTSQQLLPSSQLYIRSKDGSFYTLHPSSFIPSTLVFQTLEPNQETEGQVSFVIPKILTSPLLYVDLGWNNYLPVVYDVLK